MKNYPVIHPELTWRLLDGEAVIVSPKSGEIRVLNHVGTKIWQLIVDTHTVEEIEQALVNQYGLSPQQANADVSAFIEDLLDRGLVIWKSPVQ